MDCPGHASLIRTIISGASIIDMMFLVIDVNKVFLLWLGNLNIDCWMFGNCRVISR